MKWWCVGSVPLQLTFGKTVLRPVSQARPVQLTANNRPQVHYATVRTVGAKFRHHYSVFRCPALPQHIPTNNASKFGDLRVTDPDSKPCAKEATCQFTQTHIVCTENSEAQFGKGVLSNSRIGMLQEAEVVSQMNHHIICQAGGIPLIYRNPVSLISYCLCSRLIVDQQKQISFATTCRAGKFDRVTDLRFHLECIEHLKNSCRLSFTRAVFFVDAGCQQAFHV